MHDKICYHCGEICSSKDTVQHEFEGVYQNFCCSGCLFACRLIHDAGEADYYKNRSAFPSSIRSDNESLRSRKQEKAVSYDLQGISEEYIEKIDSSKNRIYFFIEGIHCSSCVYINEKILSWTEGIIQAAVHYETGRAVVDYDPEIIKISQIIQIIESIGYHAHPVKPDDISDRLHIQGRDLLRRMVVAGFFAGNTMMAAAATWLGFFDRSMSEEYFHLFHWLEFILSTPVFIYSADTFHRGWKSFLKSGLPGMDLLISAGISVAYFYSVYATLFRAGPVYFDTVTTIVFFLLIGRYLEWRARYDQRMKMLSLVKPPAEYCFRLNKEGERVQIPVSELKRNDTVSALLEDVLPADGVVSGEACELDESVLTGESRPVLRKFGDRVLAGSRVVSGKLQFNVDTLPDESSLNILAKLARSSGNSQADIEKITLKIVPWFSYGIFIIAGFSFLLNYCYLSQGLSGAVLSAIAVLIISCPCALALSVPTAVGSGIFLGLKKGILIRDGAVMEKMQGIKNYFFDKTGTLTEGSPSVINYSFFSDRKDIPAVIYKMEYGSSHPSGRSIRSFLEKEFPDECHQIQIDLSEVQNHPGRGLEMNHAGKISKLGSYHFIFSKNDEPDAKIRAFLSENLDSSCIFFSENDIVYAAFALKDSLRPSSKETTEILMQEGNVYILTGDSRSAAEAVGKELLLPETHVYSELKPEEKQKMIETIAEKEAVCMMGDGYNDSVALSAADVSVVLSRGAPLSLEHAQVILLNNDPYDLLTAKRISEKTMFTIRLNLIFSLGYNLIAIPFAALGYLLPVWCAVFMSVSSLTVVGSSIYFRWRGV